MANIDIDLGASALSAHASTLQRSCGRGPHQLRIELSGHASHHTVRVFFPSQAQLEAAIADLGRITLEGELAEPRPTLDVLGVLAALRGAQGFVGGFLGDGLQEGIAELLGALNGAIENMETAQP